MALAAIAYAKAKRRRQIMVATSSIGPGATNMVTAAAVAHANRLPVLLLAGDTFVNRMPDPVLQQVEHFGDPSITVNDAFKPVTRYWDRITHPEQILSSLPQAVATMLDPADCGPAFIGCRRTRRRGLRLSRGASSSRRSGPHPAPPPRRAIRSPAAELLKTAKKPLIIAGGGVRYSGAEAAGGATSPTARGIPVVETIAGKGALVHDHPVMPAPSASSGTSRQCAGGRGRRGAGHRHAASGLHHRLVDRLRRDARFIGLNAARFDAMKHRALAVVGDALESASRSSDAALGDWRPMILGGGHGQALCRVERAARRPASGPTNAEVPTYAQVVGA
jgi:3D-(3,5/4)-trihydroxycyclohexane-1,2-dione acylhydrolase (decyclizing)